MCFFVSPNDKRRHIAKVNITARKWFRLKIIPLQKQRVEIVFESPAMGYIYRNLAVNVEDLTHKIEYGDIKGEMPHSNLNPNKLDEIYVGFHALLGSAEKGNITDSSCFIQLPIIIPKGARYYLNPEDGEIVCNKFYVDNAALYNSAIVMLYGTDLEQQRNGVHTPPYALIINSIDIAIRARALSIVHNYPYADVVKQLNN